MSEANVPKDVLETPAGSEGNGFVVLDMETSSIVGSDGEIYNRKNGVVSVAPDDEVTGAD